MSDRFLVVLVFWAICSFFWPSASDFCGLAVVFAQITLFYGLHLTNFTTISTSGSLELGRRLCDFFAGPRGLWGL